MTDLNTEPRHSVTRREVLSGLRRRVSTILKFAVVPGISLVSTLLILPLVARQFGSEGWVALGLGQSVGALTGVAVGLAWPTIGANAIASATDAERGLLCLDSLVSRAIAYARCAPVAVGVVWILVAQHAFAAILFCLGTMLNGFTFAWFYAGAERPSLLIRNEAIVRLSGNLLSLPLLVITHELTVYAGVLICVGITQIVMNGRTVLPRSPWSAIDLARVRRHWRANGALAASNTVVAAGSYLSPTLVAAVAPELLVPFAALDRLTKSASSATEAVPAGLASWVSSVPPGSSQRLRRVKHVYVGLMTISTLLVAVWIPIAPSIVSFLFADKVRVSGWALGLTGLSVASYFAASAVGQLVMVPLGKSSTVAKGTFIGAIAGLAVTVVGSTGFGLVGAMLGAPTGTAVCVAWYSVVLWVEVRSAARRET